MSVLLLSKQPPFDATRVATGNQLRMRQLQDALASADITSELYWQASEDHPATDDGRALRRAGDLANVIKRYQPGAVIVGFWDLLDWFPQHPEVPVILDFLAPRPLELLYQRPDRLHQELPRLVNNLAKADRIVVGNSRQADLLSSWLLSAGHDLREPSILVAPPNWGTQFDTSKEWRRPQTPLCLAGGGVQWPWRDDSEYWHALDNTGVVFKSLRFTGDYPGVSQSPENSSSRETDPSGLNRYEDYIRALVEQADIGVDVGGAAVERRFSASFRLQDYISCGLPVIVDASIPLAEAIIARGAGWVVDNPRSFAEKIAELVQDPGQVAEAARNMRDWASNASPELAAAPLVHYLQSPERRDALPGFSQSESHPPFRTRLKRRVRLLLRAVLARLAPDEPGDGVLLISRSDVFPTNHGAAVKIIETGKAIAANGKRCFLLTHDRKHYWEFTADRVTEQKFPVWLRALGFPNAVVQLAHAGRNLPEEERFLYLPLSDHHIIARTAWLTRKHDLGVFQAEFPAYARAALWGRSLSGGTAVMVEHNVEYQRILQQVPALTQSEYRHLRAIEINLANQVDSVVCVSERDRQDLISAGVTNEKLVVIPHGVNLTDYDSSPAMDLGEKLDLDTDTALVVFHGTYSYKPNRQALQIFADELLPRWRALNINIRVIAIGRDAPQESPHEDIILTGPVDDLPAWLKGADIAVVPLTEGGGTRMKIIDYFAAGLPVVSTSKGIEGIPVEPGREALILDDWDELAGAVANLLNNPVRRETLARAGHTYARTLDWKQLGERYLSVYRRSV